MKHIRTILIVALLALILAPVTAAPFKNATSGSYSKYALGLNVGTNTGLGFQYKVNRDFDITGNLGLNNFNTNSLSFDAAATYKIAEFNIDKAKFDVTLGLGGNVGIPLVSGGSFNVSALVPVGVTYHFTNVPIDVYLRVAAGVKIIDSGALNIGFDYGAFLGGLWRFD